jgi:hypothetical protein
MRWSIAVRLLVRCCRAVLERVYGGRHSPLWSDSADWLNLLIAFRIYGPVLIVQQHV